MSIGAIGGCGYDMQSISEMRQRMFEKWDTDGSGQISADECQTAASDMSEKTGLSITADEMMAIFDLDQDGVITQSEQTEASPEWEQHMASLMEEAGIGPMGSPPPPPPSEGSSEVSDLMDEIFAAMDTNEDGVIDESEYQAAMEQISGASESDTESSSTDSSTSTTSAAESTESTDSTTSSEETTLASLLEQFLELIAKMQEESFSEEYQDSQRLNYYA